MKSSDIYWGAVPWIGLQVIMVVIVIVFPITVTGLLDKPLDVDLAKVKIEVPQIELPPLDFGGPNSDQAGAEVTVIRRRSPRQSSHASQEAYRNPYGCDDSLWIEPWLSDGN